MTNSGKGESNRRRGGRRGGGEKPPQEGQPRGGKRGGDGRADKRASAYPRLRWTPPKPPAEPIPAVDCPWCGKPIKDISSAIADKDSGQPVHFDCVLTRLAKGETLEKGDAVTYIGGGRFGVVHFNSPHALQAFKIKKVFEWENKENRATWRGIICDHFSLT